MGMTIKISGGTVHTMPTDMRKALTSHTQVRALWEDITPLACNEFICWVENAQHIETRNRRIQRSCQDLLRGKRRPCCWMGCTHRTDKVTSPSAQWVVNKRSKRLANQETV